MLLLCIDNLILAEPKKMRSPASFVEVELHQGSFMPRCAKVTVLCVLISSGSGSVQKPWFH